MKILKKIKSKLALALAAIVLITSIGPVQATESKLETKTETKKTTVNYVALGDSITEGDNSYVKYVSDYLKTEYGNCKTSNYGKSGWTSNELLNAVKNNSNMKKAISNADIITIDIGSNDVMVTAYGIVAKCFGCSMDQIGNTADRIAKKIQYGNFFEKIYYAMNAMNIAYNINNKLNKGNEMQNAMNKFESNYVAILKEVKTLAPNAKIYVGNLYNPYKNAPSMYLGSYKIVDMPKFSKTWIDKANSIIKNNTYNAKIVDLYNTITSSKYIKDVNNYDPHPNTEGHKAIANKFISAMK